MDLVRKERKGKEEKNRNKHEYITFGVSINWKQNKRRAICLGSVHKQNYVVFLGQSVVLQTSNKDEEQKSLN